MTHHGRPGGRLLELILMCALIGLSAGALCAGLGLVFLLAMFLTGLVGPAFLWPTIALVVTYFWRPIMRTAWWLAAKMWNPFLKYYGYEAHTLKPIMPKEDTK